MKCPICVEVFLKREFPKGSRSFDVLTPRPMITIRVAQSGTYRGIAGHWVDFLIGPRVRLSEVRAFRYTGAVQIKNHIDYLTASEANKEFMQSTNIFDRGHYEKRRQR